MRLLADENFNNEILRGLRRRVPTANITRVQETELVGKADTLILEWALEARYLLISHDVNTMRGYYYERINAGLEVPGLFLVHGSKPIGLVIDTLELILNASEQADWDGGIHYLPF